MSCYDEVIDKIKRVRPYLTEKFGVRRIGLFGSVARQDDGRESDVDIIPRSVIFRRGNSF